MTTEEDKIKEFRKIKEYITEKYIAERIEQKNITTEDLVAVKAIFNLIETPEDISNRRGVWRS